MNHYTETPLLTRRDRLLLCQSRVRSVAGDARAALRVARPEAREIHESIEQLAEVIATLVTLELRREK